MQQFIRLYNPHEAREDTVLFPAFRKIVSLHEFDSLGEDFEKKENELSARTDLKRLWNKWPESRSASVFTNSRSSPQKFSARCALSLA
jgi:hypothetical protein